MRKVLLTILFSAWVFSGCDCGGDTTSPTTAADPAGGYFNRTIEVSLTANEPAIVYYTTDGSTPSPENAATRSGESPVSRIVISRETLLQFFGEDTAGNREELKSEQYSFDYTPPNVLEVLATGAGSADPEAGDQVRITFDEPILDPDLNAGNIDAVLALSNGHSWLDGSGTLGEVTRDEPGTVLIITLSADTSSPTISPADTVTFDGVTITDRAGNPAAGTFEITGCFAEDLVDPESGITDPPAGTVLGGDTVVRGTASDALSGVTKVELSTDGGNTWMEVSATPGGTSEVDWSYFWQSAEEGAGQLCSRARDLAGNESDSSCVSVTVDLSSPLVHVTSPENGVIYQVPAFTVYGTASDTYSRVITVEVSLDGGETYLPAEGIADWSYAASGLNDGVYEIFGRAYDGVWRAGYSSPAVSAIVDTGPPTCAIISPAEGGFVKEQVSIQARALDAGSGVALVEIQIGDGNPWVEAVSSEAGEDIWEYEWVSSGFSDDAYTIVCRATDQIGNLGDSSPGVEIIAENGSPTITLISPIDGELIGAGNYMVSGSAFDAQSGVAGVEVSTDGGDSWKPATGADPWNYVWNVSSLVNYWGSREVLARARDAVGNVSANAGAVAHIDTIYPTVEITVPPDDSFFNYPAGSSIAVHTQASDGGVGVDYVRVNPGTGLWSEAQYDISYPDPPTGPYAATFYWVLPSAGGTYMIRARSWDEAGNESETAVASVTLDRTPPGILSADPGMGDSCVRTGTNVRIQFDEEIDTSTLDSANSGIYLEGITLVSPGDYQFFWDSTVFPNDTLTIVPFLSQPGSLLDDLSSYQVRVTGPVSDFAHNYLPADSYTFSTRDTTPPLVVSKWPEGSELIPAQYFRAVTVTFNEDMDRSRGRVSIFNEGGSSFVNNIEVGQEALSGFLEWVSPVTMALTITSPVIPGNGYRISFDDLYDDSACGSDLGENEATGLEWPVILEGLPLDVTKPVVLQTIPIEGGTVSSTLPDFAWNSVLVTLSEAVDPGTVGPGSISVFSDGIPADFSAFTRIGFDPPGVGLLIQPEFPLGATMQVYVNDGIADTAGNHLSNPLVLNFTVDAPGSVGPVLEAGQPQPNSTRNPVTLLGGLGFDRGVSLTGIGPENIRVEETAGGVPLRGIDFESLRPGIQSRAVLKPTGETALPFLREGVQYTLRLTGLQDLDANPISPDPTSFSFTVAPGGANRAPVIRDVFAAGYADVYTNLNTLIRLDLEVVDPEDDPLTVEASDGLQTWSLVSLLSDRYVYATPITGIPVPPNGGDENLGYEGFRTFTFTADDSTDTASVTRDLYVFPESKIPIQDYPTGVSFASTDPAFQWHNVDTTVTDYLRFSLMLADYSELYTEVLPPQATSLRVPDGLLVNWGYYCWKIAAVRTDYGGEVIGRGIGFSSRTLPVPLPSGSCFWIVP